MRTIAGTVLSAAGIIVAFVAPDVTKTHPWYAVPALASFAAAVLLGTYVLVPRKGLKFSERLNSYKIWVVDHGDEAGADTSFAVALAENLEANRNDNRDAVERITLAVGWQVVALGAEVIAWVIALAAN